MLDSKLLTAAVGGEVGTTVGEVVGAEVVGGEVGTTVGEVVGGEVGEVQLPHVFCASDSNCPPSNMTVSFSVTSKLPEP